MANPNKDAVWQFFPASMGDNRASIFFNQSYSEVANEDQLEYLLRLDLTFHQPNDTGLPSDTEFDALCALEDDLEKSLAKINGVYVGRISVAGKRYLYFYLPSSERQVIEITKKVEKAHNYELFINWARDAHKNGYWRELYPTDDDWQVINDLSILDILASNGDDPNKVRKIDHWASFKQQLQANQFAKWLESESFENIQNERLDETATFCVRYSHNGSMALADITRRTISSNRKAKEFEGEYEGWETSVET